MGPNESRTSVLCCVLILKQIEIFYRVTSSPLSRPAIWAMSLPMSEGPGVSSADGRAMPTAARVPDRERCVLRPVRVRTCSRARGSWPNGCMARRGYVESDGTGGCVNCSEQPPTAARHATSPPAPDTVPACCHGLPIP
jgi:hypothetical protein